jgi:hypothetical protein
VSCQTRGAWKVPRQRNYANENNDFCPKEKLAQGLLRQTQG